MEIVKLRPEEWREYKALRLEGLKNDPQAFGSSYEKQSQNPDEYWEDRLAKCEGPGQWLLFAREDGKLIGLVGAFVQEDSTIADIISMYVTPKHRGKGIARRLMEAILAAVKEQPEISVARLEVVEDQLAPLRLYESVGFQEISRKTVEKPWGEIVELTMSLPLRP